MPKFFRILFGIGFLTVCLCCAKEPKIPSIVLGAEGITLRDWLLVGLFTDDKMQVGLDLDYLSACGLAEDKWTLGSFSELLASNNDKNKRLPVEMVSTENDAFSVGILNTVEATIGSPAKIGYLACEIISEGDSSAWLLYGNDGGTKIWLNGEPLYTSKEKRPMQENNDAIPLSLRKGSNLLLLKISNQKGGWRVSARLEPSDISAARTVVEANSSVLTQELLLNKRELTLNGRNIPTSLIIEASLETQKGNPIRYLKLSGRTPADLSDLDPGLYRLRFSLGEKQYQQYVYIGGLNALCSEMAARVKRENLDDRTYINLSALLHRLELLAKLPLNNESKEPQYKEEDAHKALFAAAEMNDILNSLVKGEEPFRDRRGLHLRGFRSQIDDQPMHYRVFVPLSYVRNGVGLPLIIVPATVFSPPRPFLDSLFVARHGEAEQWCRIAERLGVGILWPGYRNSPYGNPVDFAHMDEVLEAVAAEYRLDTSRLYLLGGCSTGLTSSMEAVRNPSRYAAVAMVNPVMHRLKNKFYDSGEYKNQPAYRAWLKETDPFNAFATMPNIPVLILHDGFDPDHGPLAQSVEFVESSRAYGNHPEFFHEKIPRVTRISVYEKLMVWLAKQRRANAGPLTFNQSPSYGPLSRALAERFVLVRGTQGTESEKVANTRWCKEFENTWLRSNFVQCRVVSDVDLSDKEQRDSNLVIIGNPVTNLVWKRFEGSISLLVGADKVVVKNKEWVGGGLGLQAWCRNPDFPNRRIVFIGAADLDNAAVGSMELALDGWFDFAVWKREGNEVRLLEADRYAEKENTGVL
jgi:hypothetical protein